MSNFEQWLTSQQAQLEAWGRYVVEEVCESVNHDLGEERCIGFFKVPPTSRVKNIESAVNKQNKKKYKTPESEMTDLVGARFVVLLRTDIDIVERTITKNGGWTVRRDRSPADERDAAPMLFDYQSVHYILRNPVEKLINGVCVAAEVACEVQIRTVLQHAYAELGHDRIYKGNGPIPNSVRRLVARSMALMETTDEMFCAAVRELECVNLDRVSWASLLDGCYRDASITFNPTLEDEDSITIIDTFANYLKHANSDEVKAFSTGRRLAKIKSLSKEDNLFTKPITILVFWLVKNNDQITRRNWPLPRYNNELEQIFSELGIAY